MIELINKEIDDNYYDCIPYVWDGSVNIKHIKWKVGRYKKNPIKLLSSKTTMCKIKNTLNEINELGISKLGDIALQ